MSHERAPPLAVVESQPAAEAPARRFTLIRAADLKTRAVDWLIQDYLEADTLSLVFGDPGCGKSFLAIDAACCVAADLAFHDKTVRHAPVVYIAGEGQNGLARRFNARSIRHGIPLDDLPLYVSTGPAALCDAESALDVRQAVDEIAEAEGSPGLVVVDTLARNFGPGDENSTQEMGAVIQALDAIRSHHQAPATGTSNAPAGPWH